MQPLLYLIALLFPVVFATASQISTSSLPIQQRAMLEDSLIGNWVGTSICQVRDSPCRDENVVFHIAAGNGANQYKVRADKIVKGQPIDMGELDFKFAPATQTLTCTTPSGTWVLVVNDRHIDGTLTNADKVLYRKLSLAKAG